MPHGHFSHRGQARTSFLSDVYPTAAAAAQHKLGGFFLPLHYYYYIFVSSLLVESEKGAPIRRARLPYIAGKTASKCQAVPTTRGCWENFKRREEKGGAVISLVGRSVYTHKQAHTHTGWIYKVLFSSGAGAGMRTNTSGESAQQPVPVGIRGERAAATDRA